jgi:hypothetical protein
MVRQSSTQGHPVRAGGGKTGQMKAQCPVGESNPAHAGTFIPPPFWNRLLLFL